MNLYASKSVPKGVMVTVGAENLFNKTRLAGGNSVLTSQVFGIPNRALSARRLELAIRYGF